ncbi:hypothetical protein ACWD25_22150 [Streptomyces sp. NPDC002920]
MTTPRHLTFNELAPLAFAASQVDAGIAPHGSVLGPCPDCGLGVTSGEGRDRLPTLDTVWTARPCGCQFLVTDAVLDGMWRVTAGAHAPYGS